MTRFEPIYARALERNGSDDEIFDYLQKPTPKDELAAMPDDRWLAAITKCVFAAGFRWRVIQAKWDGFEDAFLGFEPEAVAEFDESAVEALRHDTRIVRNPRNIVSTVENARFVASVSAEHDGFGRFATEWPDDDMVGLWAYLKKHGSRLGGHTGPRSLRLAGRDTFILTGDVTYGLTELGIMTASATSKRGRAEAQAAFSAWQAETGRSFAELSVILARSVDRPVD
jgi:3-methyladenine DNA glycosylase Tag